MPTEEKPKSAYQLRQELAAAEKREAEEARQGVLAKLQKEYEGKYFWFARKYSTSIYVGMVHLYNFKLDGSENYPVNYNYESIDMCHNDQPPSKWTYGSAPVMRYEKRERASMQLHDTPVEYRNATREGSAAEFKLLVNKLREVTNSNLTLFQGLASVYTPPDETVDRPITVGAL